MMGWEALVTLVVVVLVFSVLATNAAGPDVALMGGALTLVSLSVFSPEFPTIRDLAQSFGNEGVLTVAALYAVAAGLTETGGMAVLTGRLLGSPTSVWSAQLRVAFPVVGISAFLNNTPVVAMFIPVVQDWCKKTGITPSKLFIPLSYFALLGGVCTLIGTSTNLVVHALMVNARSTDPDMPLMGMFTLAPVGVAGAVAGIAFIVATARWLLPDRTAFRAEVADPRRYSIEMLVDPGGAVDGLSIERAGLRQLPGSFLSAIERDGETIVAVGPEQVLRGSDRLVFVGDVASVVDLQRVRGLVPATDQVSKLTVARRRQRLVEVVVSHANPLVGKSIRDGRFRTRYDAAVLAVYRDGERLSGRIGDIVLRAGDTLLLQASNRFPNEYRTSRDFLLVSGFRGSRPVRHEKAWIALAIMAGMVAVASMESRTGIGVFHAALLAAAAMGVTGCISPGVARRSVDVPVIVAIVAALVIGGAVERTGLARAFAGLLIGVAVDSGPWAVLAAVYVLTLVMTEIVTNNAAAALAFPIAHAAAKGLGVDFMPFAVTIAIAASAGFASPLGYQTHMMVLGPGGYRFADFARIGLPLDILIGVITVTVTPIYYPF